MNVRQVEWLNDRAEGRCDGVPYNTELVNINGVSIHFWFGDETPSTERVESVLSLARSHRDIVRAQWSPGEPTSFWAQADIIRRRA